MSTGIGELDRVLGGGLAEGAVVLVGGDPGIGKSTLLLQALAQMTHRCRGCTSPARNRWRRSPAVRNASGCRSTAACAGRNRVERILEHAAAARPRLIVADSVQTLWTEALTAAPGSVSQVRESAARLVRYAKETGTAVFLVGHVTRKAASPARACSSTWSMRCCISRATRVSASACCAFKNRFGAVNELGVFAMGDKGLREVPNRRRSSSPAAPRHSRAVA